MGHLLRLSNYYAIILITLAFSAGIVFGHYFPIPDEQFLLVSCLAILLIVMAFLLRKIFSQLLFTLTIVIISVVLGLLHISNLQQLPDSQSHIYNLLDTEKEAVVIATMLEMPKQGEISTAVVEGEFIRFAEDSSLKKVEGKIQISIRGELLANIHPGETFIFRAKIKRVHNYNSPGAFDYAKHLATKGIWAVGFIPNKLYLRKLENQSSPPLRQKIERMRSKIGKQLEEFAPKHAGLYKAILLGDKSEISSLTRDLFVRAGALHILAVSGLHLTVLFGISYAICYWLLSRSTLILLHLPTHTTATLLALLPLLFYLLITGFQPPVVRAFIMCAVTITAIVLRNRTSAGTLLATAALLMLLVNPLWIFSASFQLSFTAVAVIFILLPIVQKIFTWKKKYNRYPVSIWKQLTDTITNRILSMLSAGLLLSAGIVFFSAPVTIGHFHVLSVISPIANLLLEPLYCLWALPCGMLAVLFLLTENLWLAQKLLQFGAVGLQAGEKIVTSLASIPHITWWPSTPAPWFAIASVLFYFGLLCIISGSQKFTDQEKTNEYAFHAIPLNLRSIGVVIFACSLPIFFLRPQPVDRVTFLDVGQGSATVVEFMNGENFLIDGGGSPFTSVDVGMRVIAPYLWRRGISHLDGIILSHPDADHSNGIPFIARHFSPASLWVRDNQEQHQNLAEIYNFTKSTVIKEPYSGEIIAGENKRNIEVKYNFKTSATNIKLAANRGIVSRVTFNGCSVLLPGDIDQLAEDRLLENDIISQTTLLLAAHHGSATSNSALFLNKLKPEAVLVSASQGRSNYYPSKELVNYTKTRGISLYETAKMGTVEMECKNGRPRFYYYQKPQKNPLRPYFRKEL